MNSGKYIKKALCPFGASKHCFSCEVIGRFIDCPLTVQEKLSVEVKEGNYRGVEPYAIFRAVRKAVRRK